MAGTNVPAIVFMRISLPGFWGRPSLSRPQKPSRFVHTLFLDIRRRAA